MCIRDSVRIGQADLTKQVKKYKEALRKQLRAHGEDAYVETICVLGDQLEGWNDSVTRREEERALSSMDIRVTTYRQLIKEAEASYQSYLRVQKEKAGKLAKILEEINET